MTSEIKSIQQILIVGKGKLAQKIIDELPLINLSFRLDQWGNHKKYSPKDINCIVHVGSGKELPEVILYCEINKIPLIQGATGTSSLHEASFPYIDAPNFSILVLKFLCMLKRSTEIFLEHEITIFESHQASKKTDPGTAFEIADFFRFNRNKITNLRDRQAQMIFGIPEKYLDQHAVHQIEIKAKSSKLTMKLEVYGLDSYLEGLEKILVSIGKLENRLYHITELIDNGFI